jgi:hypothetical protein
MSNDQGKPIILIGPKALDGTVRLEGRDWFYDYCPKPGDPSPREMGLKIEWLVSTHAMNRMERAAQALKEERRARGNLSYDDMVSEMLRMAQEEMGFNAG